MSERVPEQPNLATCCCCISQAAMRGVAASSPRRVLCSVVLPDIGAGEDSADASASAAVGPQSQRITPYMNKVVARPTSTIKSYSPSTGGKFAGRQGSGSVVASLNSHLEVPPVAEGDAMELDGAKPTGVPRCTVQVLGQAQGAHAKYMVDRLEDKVRALSRGPVLRAANGGPDSLAQIGTWSARVHPPAHRWPTWSAASCEPRRQQKRHWGLMCTRWRWQLSELHCLWAACVATQRAGG